VELSLSGIRGSKEMCGDVPLKVLLGLRLGGIEPVLPARTPRPRQPCGGARSRTRTSVHMAPSIPGAYARGCLDSFISTHSRITSRSTNY